MRLQAGVRIGPYEVEGLLGSGGMGEVYRATDTRLNRPAAIKVLPHSFAADDDRLARFRREAQVLAALSHPNIGAIYGLEETETTLALALELVEGPTLADRLRSGAVPVDEALGVASQLAAALEAAHERGIIHRDLKPANIKLAPDGTVKVLDFGLAKVLAPETPPQQDLTSSPTEVRATHAGVILGTAPYMAPEQAKGKTVDRRADIWAFGCVLYEMLAGRPAFDGETITDVLAAVVRDDPDWHALPPLHPAVARLLRRCLDRDPRRRLRDIGEARIALEEAATPAPEEKRPRGRGWLWAASGIAAALAILYLMWSAGAPRPPGERALLRLGIEAGADAALPGAVPAVEGGLAGSGWLGATVTLARAGDQMAFVARGASGGPWQLYVRRLDRLEATPLARTEGAYAPFFSPDGRWIAYFAPGKLMKVPVGGGTPVTVAPTNAACGGAWGEDGTIVFTPDSEGPLLRVSSDGGPVTPATTLEPQSENTHRWPQMLEGGKAVLFTAHGGTTSFDDANIVVQPLPSGPRKVLVRGGFYARYLPSGHILYMRERKLFAVPFDLQRLEVTGRAVPVLDDVAHAAINGGAEFSWADNGLFLYRRTRDRKSVLNWIDLAGNVQPLRSAPADYAEIRFAPDGNRLAMEISDGKQSDIWVYDIPSDATSRLTFYTDNDSGPVWSADGRRLAYSSWRHDVGTTNIFWQRVDGTGEVERLTHSRRRQQAFSWHPSGKYLAFGEVRTEHGWDVMILPMEGEEESGWRPGEPFPFASSPANESKAAFSRDGRWLSYVSDESGRSEVYVRPFPGPGGRWQISSDGGSWAEWARSSDVLYVGTPEETVMAVPYRAEGESFNAGKIRLWLRMPADYNWVVPHPDGTRAAMIKSDDVRRDALILLTNFGDELQRVSPPR